MNRYKGFICGAGFLTPQIQLQFMPLYWGLSVAASRTKIGLQLGPFTVMLWFTPRTFSSESFFFNDQDE